jgi:hypothetical protein
MTIEADLTFYRSGSPLRATVRNRRGNPEPIREPQAVESFAEALELSATMAAGNPWLERFPWLVHRCIPMRQSDTWVLRDAHGHSVPFPRAFGQAWPLFAISGGHPATVFGEWNGRTLLPLSVLAEGTFTALGGSRT